MGIRVRAGGERERSRGSIFDRDGDLKAGRGPGARVGWKVEDASLAGAREETDCRAVCVEFIELKVERHGRKGKERRKRGRGKRTHHPSPLPPSAFGNNPNPPPSLAPFPPPSFPSSLPLPAPEPFFRSFFPDAGPRTLNPNLPFTPPAPPAPDFPVPFWLVAASALLASSSLLVLGLRTSQTLTESSAPPEMSTVDSAEKEREWMDEVWPV